MARKKQVDNEICDEPAVEQPPNKYDLSEPNPEWIVVADHTSEILLSTIDKQEVDYVVDLIRRGGGSATVFVSTGD